MDIAKDNKLSNLGYRTKVTSGGEKALGYMRRNWKTSSDKN